MTEPLPQAHGLRAFSCQTSTNLRPTPEEEDQICDLVSRYEAGVNCSPIAAVGELRSWYQFLSAMKKRPRTPLEHLEVCDEEETPVVKALLKILCPLPVTTSSAERSFSTLRFLKSYLRSTMGDDRLNGLAMLYIHRDIPITVEEVLDRFAKKSRRLDFGEAS